MSQISSWWMRYPGMGTLVESFEAAYTWGPYPRFFQGANIALTAADPTNTPTNELRIGLVLGKRVATNDWVQYSPTASDGSEVAQGVLPYDLRMQDVLLQTNLPRFGAVLVSGGVKASMLLGLDLNARQQMAGNFWFDDTLVNSHQFPFQRFQTKTANYQIVASDNLTQFDNNGATGAVTFTLPPIANGYYFGFRVVANQNLTVASTEGNNVVKFNSAAGASVAFTTGGQLIGGGLAVYSNPAGTLWFVDNTSAGANTVS